MLVTKITEQNQIEIPYDVREDLELNIGDEVVFIREDDRYYVKTT